MSGHLGNHQCRLHVEPLEDRRMLAVATVNTELDVVDFTDGVTSLREAIFAANTLAGPDTIEFDASLDGATINVVQALGELTITDSLMIDASSLASGLTIDAGNGTDNTFATGDGIRIFHIDDGDNGSEIDVAMVGLTLTGGDSDDRTGGAIRSLENLSITSSTISGNSVSEDFFAAEGGGIYIRYGNLSLNDCTISENTAQGEFLVLGGGITARSSDVTITRSSVSGNVTRSSQGTSYGAGLLINGNLTLTESLVADNRTEGDGWAGGMYLIGGQHHISESTISGNQSSHAGGIYVAGGDLDVTKSTIERNVTSGFGGGLQIVESDVSISQSTITGNSARRGGAIGIINKIDDLPMVLISHSTISGNTADDQGGGIEIFFGRVVIQSSTVTKNSAPVGFGSGIASRGSEQTSTDVFSSIIAGNTNDDVAIVNGPSNSFQSLGYNLIGSGNSFDSGAQNALDNFGQAGDQTGVINSLLGPLADNGGTTQTHALLPGSPALDAGNSAETSDQRGLGVPVDLASIPNAVGGNASDIGAYEAQVAPSADYVDNDLIDGFDFLAWQLGFGTTVGATRPDGNSDDDGDVDASDLTAWEFTYGQVDVTPLAGFAVVGDDTARFEQRAVRSPATAPLSNAQLVDLALAMHFSGTFAVAENPSPRVFGKWASLQGRGTDGALNSREEAFATLSVSPRQDEDAAVVLAGERRLGLAGDVAERDFADQGLQTLDDVPLGGEFFPDF